jgi:iron(III) transport system permease protein
LIRSTVALAALGTAATLASLTDARGTALLANTTWLVAGTLLISLPLGSTLGILLSRTDLAGRRLMAALLFAPVLVPLYLQAAAWQAGFGLSGWYSPLAGDDFEQPLLTGWRATIWIHACAATPLVALFVGLAARNIDRSLEEAALLDQGVAAVFRRVTLRLVAPALVLAAVWISVQVAGEMTVTDFYGIRTYAEEIYTDLNLGRWTAISQANTSEVEGGPPPAAAGFALWCLLIALAIWFAATIASASLRVETRPPLVFRLGQYRWPLTLLVVVALALFVGLPLVNLIYKAGVQVTEQAGMYSRAWSPKKFIAMIAAAPRENQTEFAWSAAIALAAASLVIALALPLAWFARTSRIAAAVALSLGVVTLATPGPLVGLAVIQLLNSPHFPPLNYLYDHTITAPVIAQAVRAFPLGLFIVWHAFRTIPQQLMEAAALDGASSLARLTLALRLRHLAVILAWTGAFIVAFGELAATILVVPPGVTTLPVHIFGLLHYNVEDQVAAISLVLLAVHVAAALALLAIGRRAFRLRFPVGRQLE